MNQATKEQPMTTPLAAHARRLTEFADKSGVAAKANPDDWMQQIIASNQRDAAGDAQEESEQMTAPTLREALCGLGAKNGAGMDIRNNSR